ncbi:hypothetical protein [Burkholderia plantarii]|uniref:hypothetical protein n=1 Tax=Burkholderia plantarii TaxID=41899 RepID=UPI000F4D331C|nr:hypothetical protein [Burkholderia plantarii]
MPDAPRLPGAAPRAGKSFQLENLQFRCNDFTELTHSAAAGRAAADTGHDGVHARSSGTQFAIKTADSAMGGPTVKLMPASPSVFTVPRAQRLVGLGMHRPEPPPVPEIDPERQPGDDGPPDPPVPRQPPEGDPPSRQPPERLAGARRRRAGSTGWSGGAGACRWKLRPGTPRAARVT